VENITAGKAEVEAKLDGIKLYSGTFDLCKDVLPQVNLKCPVPAGQHSITVKTKIPEAAPRVSNHIKSTMREFQAAIKDAFLSLLIGFLWGAWEGWV
jgi:hypothetical protein